MDTDKLPTNKLPTFKDYLLRLADESLPDDEKEDKKKPKSEKEKDKLVPLGLLKYMQNANAGGEQ